jgi:phosphoglycolate phosphatase-like HAD superfamily hydrolase
LLRQAGEDLGFSPEKSIVIGDKASDIEMGHMAGALTYLVRTGYGSQVSTEKTVQPDFIVNDLLSAMASIRNLLRRENGR